MTRGGNQSPVAIIVIFLFIVVIDGTPKACRIDKNTNTTIIKQKGAYMIFVSMLEVIPGKVDEVHKIIKTIKVPKDIKIREFLSLFGKPDYILTFEAPSEEKALSFILKFVSVAVPKTSLGMPVERK